MTSLITRKWPLFLLALLFLWMSTGFSSRRIETGKPDAWREKKFTYLPEGRLLKPMLLGHDHAAASILWTQGVLYFADAFLEGESYEWLGHILMTVMNLDPKFGPVYERGALMMPQDLASQKTSLKILKRGVRELPENYRIRFYAAMTQLAVDSNHLAAADYLKPVTRNESAPTYIRNLATTVLNSGGYQNEWLDFLLGEYLEEASPLQKENILDRIVELILKSAPDADRNDLEKLLGLVAQDPKLLPMIKQALLEITRMETSEKTRNILDVLNKGG